MQMFILIDQLFPKSIKTVDMVRFTAFLPFLSVTSVFLNFKLSKFVFCYNNGKSENHKDFHSHFARLNLTCISHFLECKFLRETFFFL